MKVYSSLFKQFKDQSVESIFSHFYPAKIQTAPEQLDFDAPFKSIAVLTVDGYDSWEFQQARFKTKYSRVAVPKLKNYLNYTFIRLNALEQNEPGKYFLLSSNGEWVCFNTGLQNPYGVDLLATFQKYQARDASNLQSRPDWVFKGCYASNDRQHRHYFGNETPDIAWYSTDSRDFIFDTSYLLDKDAFDHLFDRAKERAGLPSATDDAVRNYLRGAIENLVPKIRRNYKVAIPVYFVEEKRMQLLLPFVSASDPNDVSCFLVERDDTNRSYHLKTIFDLDQAYFSARLITRPDRDWLNP